MMESLPLEMMWKIAEYLSAQDLSACCSVSRGWRDIFSHDALWQPHCDPSLAEYLRTTPCTVEPGFVSPEGEDSTLSPVGHWRLAFMRENHLWNNWQRGRCTIGPDIRTTPFYEFGFLGNDTLLLINENGFIDLFNMITLEKKESSFRCLPNTYYLSANINFGLLINSSGVRVVMIDEETKDIVIKFIFFFDESEKMISNSIDEFKSRHSERFRQGGEFNEDPFVCGTVFVGRLPNDLNLHIWDLKFGNKLKTENCSFIGDYKLIHTRYSLSSEIIILVFRSNQKRDKIVYKVYSLKQLSFLPFSLSTTYKEVYNVRRIHCAVHKHYIALIDPTGQLSVYNCFSADLIYSCPVDCTADLVIIDNFFIFRYEGYTHAFNPITRNRSKLHSSNGHLPLYQLNQKFLILWGPGRLFLFNKASSYKEFVVSDLLLDQESYDTIKLDNTFTRLFRALGDDSDPNFSDTFVIEYFW